MKTNFVVTIGKTSHRCYVTKAAEPKLYGLIPLGGGSTVSDAICARRQPRR
ncbi:lipoprotein [Klebsiella pneumoniae]|nr:lipoprotein [Klebsiella pneumoniae]